MESVLIICSTYLHSDDSISCSHDLNAHYLCSAFSWLKCVRLIYDRMLSTAEARVYARFGPSCFVPVGLSGVRIVPTHHFYDGQFCFANSRPYMNHNVLVLGVTSLPSFSELQEWAMVIVDELIGSPGVLMPFTGFAPHRSIVTSWEMTIPHHVVLRSNSDRAWDCAFYPFQEEAGIIDHQQRSAIVFRLFDEWVHCIWDEFDRRRFDRTGSLYVRLTEWVLLQGGQCVVAMSYESARLDEWFVGNQIDAEHFRGHLPQVGAMLCINYRICWSSDEEDLPIES